MSALKSFKLKLSDQSKKKEEEINAEKTESQNQLQIHHLAASRVSELELLQEELKGKIRANDSNIKEIVEKILARF